MGIGSIAGTPHSDSTSTLSRTPGKTPHHLALPGLEQRSPLQESYSPYEVEEPADEDVMKVER